MIWLRQFRCPICGRVSLQTWAPTYGTLNLPQSLADPGSVVAVRGRESALCVLQIYDLKCDFEKRIWRNIFCLWLCQRLGLRLLVSSFRLPGFRLTFHFCRSKNIFFLFFYFFLCCPFADKHIRVLLFLLFFCILLCSLLISFLFVRSLGLLVCGICWWCRVVCQACEKMLR